ncbi:uncharacterized protein LOC135964018 [Calliphora vicina]|uniref:uncharacterized protein LOC135964018 n=1 Tax=Calliphora vicina TaxID=7373 RepID=UPI00325A86B5
MIVVEQIKYLLEGLVRGSVAVIVDGSLSVCKEIFKFTLILLIVYYFAMWSFEFLNEVLPVDQIPISNEIQNDRNPESDLVAHQIVGETCLRIGPPNETLIKQRASLLEQLEIEAEFEENQGKFIKSEADLEQFVNKEIHKATSNTSDIDDIIEPFKNPFISQIKQELNETSRASQTLKTSLGKKSKLREDSDNRPSTSTKSNIYQEEEDILSKLDTKKHTDIKREILSEEDVESHNKSRLSKTKRSSKHKEERLSFDDEYDHESFHRV